MYLWSITMATQDQRPKTPGQEKYTYYTMFPLSWVLTCWSNNDNVQDRCCFLKELTWSEVVWWCGMSKDPAQVRPKWTCEVMTSSSHHNNQWQTSNIIKYGTQLINKLQNPVRYKSQTTGSQVLFKPARCQFKASSPTAYTPHTSKPILSITIMFPNQMSHSSSHTDML